MVQDQVPQPLEELERSKAVPLAAAQSVAQEELTAFEEGPVEQRVAEGRLSVEWMKLAYSTPLLGSV